MNTLPKFQELFKSTCSNVEQVKKLYKDLAKKYHPDINKELGQEPFKELSNAYIEILKMLDGSQRADGKTYKYSDVEEELVKKAYDIYRVCNPEVSVYIVGLWLWVEGKSYPFRTQLKELGLKWSASRSMWYYGLVSSNGYHKGSFSAIAEKYGLEKVANNNIKKEIAEVC
jgi:hypothetical protein